MAEDQDIHADFFKNDDSLNLDEVLESGISYFGTSCIHLIMYCDVFVVACICD